MAALKLYSYAGDFRSYKALIAAEYNGVTIERPDFVLGKDNVTAEFAAKNPLGKVPLLETAQGVVFESNAIARYVAKLRRDTELMGKSFFETAQVEAWLDFASHEVELPATLWVYPVLGYVDFKQAVHDKAAEDLHKALAVLERHLLSRTFVVGEAVTLADIALVAALFYPFKLVLDAGARAAYPSVTRWFITCVNQAQFRAVLGDVPLCETPAKGGKAAAAAPKAKADKPKAEAAPKAEKKKEEKPAPEPKDATEEILAAEPKKAADPFAGLPKSQFNLDEWKRTYSNSKPNYAASMPWFWEHHDAAGYTLWLQKYKYNEENKKDFMTSNLVGGFIQRSEEMRKYAFGVMHVLNNSAPYEVEGAWLMRGGDEGLKLMLDSNPDAEYYEWTKLDPASEADRATITAYWGEQEKLNGKEIYDNRQFK